MNYFCLSSLVQKCEPQAGFAIEQVKIHLKWKPSCKIYLPIEHSWDPFLERPAVTFGSENNLKSKPVEFKAAQFSPSSQTGQFYFVNWYFHGIIFKVIDIKQLLRPETFSGLSRNGAPLTPNFKLSFYVS